MRLENFVKENREAFDDKMPKEFLWDNIETRLNELEPKVESIVPKTKVVHLRQRIYSYAKVAAVGLILLVAGGFIGSYWTMQQQKSVTLGSINEEYEELESFYSQKVNQQLSKLKKYKYDKNIVNDIEELDVAFKELEKELKEQGEEANNELIVNEMIDNYQAKIEILERVLNGLEKNKKETNEKVSL
ncbi:MAG: hypothetical protein AB8G11_23695 [Saprospiraceae bacterium]